MFLEYVFLLYIYVVFKLYIFIFIFWFNPVFILRKSVSYSHNLFLFSTKKEDTFS